MLAFNNIHVYNGNSDSNENQEHSAVRRNGYAKPERRRRSTRRNGYGKVGELEAQRERRNWYAAETGTQPIPAGRKQAQRRIKYAFPRPDAETGTGNARDPMGIPGSEPISAGITPWRIRGCDSKRIPARFHRRNWYAFALPRCGKACGNNGLSTQNPVRDLR